MITLEEIRRKARYGHRAYVYWRDAAGALSFAAYGRAGLKSAILATGSKRPIHWLDGAGCSHIARGLDYKIHLWRCAPRGS